MMDFYDILDRVVDLLQRRGRVSYRALQRQFDLDEAYLEDLKIEIIKSQRLAVDEAGEVLVWTGGPGSAPVPPTTQERPPLAYTPHHLAEKILTSRNALTGERKQVTVLFADLKDSTELIRGLDPVAHQKRRRNIGLQQVDLVQHFDNDAFILMHAEIVQHLHDIGLLRLG